MTPSKRQSYTAAQKLNIIHYAEAHGNRAASRQFDGVKVLCACLRCSQRECLENMPHNKKACRGLPPAFPELQAELLEWVTDLRKQGSLGVCVAEVRLKAQAIAKTVLGQICLWCHTAGASGFWNIMISQYEGGQQLHRNCLMIMTTSCWSSRNFSETA